MSLDTHRASAVFCINRRRKLNHVIQSFAHAHPSARVIAAGHKGYTGEGPILTHGKDPADEGAGLYTRRVPLEPRSELLQDTPGLRAISGVALPSRALRL